MITRCVRCLMPDTYPDITFNADGICNHCSSYVKPKPLGEDKLLQKVHSKHGSQYDCVLGISGGKDSCYVAYLAKKKFGLRVLAVSYDFPFMVDLARENTQAVCENLGIELLVVKISQQFRIRPIAFSLNIISRNWHDMGSVHVLPLWHRSHTL